MKEVSYFFYRDGDSILDFLDNCPSQANGDQSDIDRDGTGNFYAPNFKKVEGAYCFGLVRPSIRLSALCPQL